MPAVSLLLCFSAIVSGEDLNSMVDGWWAREGKALKISYSFSGRLEQTSRFSMRLDETILDVERPSSNIFSFQETSLIEHLIRTV